MVEPLPAYAPELNPVEGLWSSLKAVELANLTLPILAAVIDQAHRGIDRVRRTRTRTWPTRSCGTPACRSRDRGQPLPNSSAMVEESSPPRCDPRCMRHQPPQRRYWRWFCLLMMLGMLIAVPLVLAAHHRQQGVEGRCAVHLRATSPNWPGTTGAGGGCRVGCASSNGMGDGGRGVSGRRQNTSRSMASAKSTPETL